MALRMTLVGLVIDCPICGGAVSLTDAPYKTSRPAVRAPHLRFNMKGERDGVRAKLKRRKTHVLSDESDVEIVEMPIAVSKGKRRCEGSPEDIKKPIPIRLRFSVSMTYNSFQRGQQHRVR